MCLCMCVSVPLTSRVLVCSTRPCLATPPPPHSPPHTHCTTTTPHAIVSIHWHTASTAPPSTKPSSLQASPPLSSVPLHHKPRALPCVLHGVDERGSPRPHAPWLEDDATPQVLLWPAEVGPLIGVRLGSPGTGTQRHRAPPARIPQQPRSRRTQPATTALHNNGGTSTHTTSSWGGTPINTQRRGALLIGVPWLALPFSRPRIGQDMRV